MRDHAHVVVVPCQERSLAYTFQRRALQFSVKVAGNLWQERFHSYLMDERKSLGSLMKSLSSSLFSQSTIFRQIRLTRRSVQSQAKNLVSHSTNPCRLPPCKSHFPLSLSA